MSSLLNGKQIVHLTKQYITDVSVPTTLEEEIDAAYIDGEHMFLPLPTV